MTDSNGGLAPHPTELTAEIRSQLNAVSTATLTSQLQRRGIRSSFFSGLKPTRPAKRLLGYALTLRYVPMREDLRQELAGGVNAQRRAIEGRRTRRGHRDRGPRRTRRWHLRRYLRDASLEDQIANLFTHPAPCQVTAPPAPP